jgi:hypothetical protein
VNNSTSSREEHIIFVDESHDDISVLYVGANKEWKAEQIKAELEKRER